MKITVNGEKRDVPEGMTVSALLDDVGLRDRNVAVEHNSSLVVRTDFDSTMLSDGDKIEIVQFVGGG